MIGIADYINLVGLALTTIAATLMCFYPPAITRYTANGEAGLSFLADSTEAGKKIGQQQQRFSRVGPLFLIIGFLVQIVGVIFPHMQNSTGLTNIELFNLRSKCAQLGQEFIEKNSFPPFIGKQLSYYDPLSNRCYIKETEETSEGVVLDFLRDGQTQEVLARTFENSHEKTGWVTNEQTHQQEEVSYSIANSYIRKVMFGASNGNVNW